jgi:hypothetical protein
MKAIKAMGTVNEQGQLSLDHPLIIDKTSRVEVIVLIPEETEAAKDNPTNKRNIKNLGKKYRSMRNDIRV